MAMAITDQALNITTETVFLRDIPGYMIVVAEPDHTDEDWDVVVKIAGLYDRDLNHDDLFDTPTGHLVWVVAK